MFLAFPQLVLAMAFTAALGPNLTNTILAIGLVDWTVFARLARAETIKIKGQPYIEAIQSLGAGKLRDYAAPRAAHGDFAGYRATDAADGNDYSDCSRTRIPRTRRTAANP